MATSGPEEIVWAGYGGDAQHAAQSKYAMAPMQMIAWSFPVDVSPPYSGSDLYAHYGEAAITANSIVLPQTQKNGTYSFNILSTATGALTWTYTTNYVLPPSWQYSGWVPPVSGTLLPNGSYVGPVGGGGVFVRPHVDAIGLKSVTYHKCGAKAYTAQQAIYDQNLFVCTPITSDAYGSVYYGVHANTTLPDGTTNGYIKMTVNGTFSMYTSASGFWPQFNAAPALSKDGTKMYVVEASTNGAPAQIEELNAVTMQLIASKPLLDPVSGYTAWVSTASTSSPLIGPDGDVYYGVLENPFSSDRGWLLHWTSNLTPKGVPGGFGWDDTPSIVPASSVPGYSGPASYLLFCKYNNYAGYGGGVGNNMVAVVDPTTASTDPRTGAQVMKPIIEVVGVTPDYEWDGTFPNAVREWCINSAAVDPIGKAIAVNSEDGSAYRLDMTTGTLKTKTVLTSGIGEAYTPTAIGKDGTVYAVSGARIFAIRAKPSHVAMATHKTATGKIAAKK